MDRVARPYRSHFQWPRRSAGAGPMVALPSLLTFLLLGLPMASLACFNDRDTLAEEVRRSPDVTRVITGRFERNPPLYYRMRIDRIAAKAARGPIPIDEFDDIAVAYDRIGQDDDAIDWITRKRVILPPYDAANATLKEHWYRYYANLGTFRVHRWAHAGADRKRIGEVVAARDEIRQAIAIKPDAHFGREKYQLHVMDWIINPITKREVAQVMGHQARLFDRHIHLRPATQRAIAMQRFRAQYPAPGGRDWATYGWDPYGEPIIKPIVAVSYLKNEWALLLKSDPRMTRRRGDWIVFLTNSANLNGYLFFRRADISSVNARRDSPILTLIRQHLLTAVRLRGGSITPHERQQLDAVAWAQSALAGKFDPWYERAGALSDYLDDSLYEESQRRAPTWNYHAEAATGLSGLVSLGAAWESVDIFEALANELMQSRNQDRIASLCTVRVAELRNNGRRSLMADLLPPGGAPFSGSAYTRSNPSPLENDYHTLRKEAEEWQSRRTAYMMARLQAGRHPDTDPTFWNEWHDSGPPRLHEDPFSSLYYALGKPTGEPAVFAVLLLAAAAIAVPLIVRGVRAQMRRRTATPKLPSSPCVEAHADAGTSPPFAE
jgi:hypothetical protein